MVWFQRKLYPLCLLVQVEMDVEIGVRMYSVGRALDCSILNEREVVERLAGHGVCCSPRIRLVQMSSRGMSQTYHQRPQMTGRQC